MSRRCFRPLAALALATTAALSPIPSRAEAGPHVAPPDDAALKQVYDAEHAPVSPEQARTMLEGTARTARALLDVFHVSDKGTEDGLRRQLDALEQQVNAATPEQLEQVASTMGPDLRRFERYLAVDAYGLLTAAAQQQADEGPMARPKSAGFPELRTDVPEDPNILAGHAVLDVVLTPIADLVDLVDDLAGSFHDQRDVDLCRYTVGADGRAERRADSAVWNDHVAMGAEELRSQLMHDYCGGLAVDVLVLSGGYGCDLCCWLDDIITGFARIFFDMKMLCEDMIDASELEATYHHVKTTYDAVAHVHGDLETVDGKLDFVSDTVESIAGTTDQILDAVTCRPVAQLNRQHGCDGMDSDCDGAIDECDEDVFGPDLHVDEAVGLTWYASQGEAIASVLRAVSATDDCKAVDVAVDSVAGSCGAVSIALTARDACGNASTRTAVVKVDGSAPTVTLAAGIEGTCHSSVAAAEAAVLAASSITDDCTPNGQLSIAVQSAVTDCTLRVRVTATDLAGRSASAAATVRVDAGDPKVAIDRQRLAGECFDTEADARAAVLAATRIDDNCTRVFHPVVTSSGSPCSLAVRVRIEDECGRAAQDEATVRVDATAPVVVAGVSVPRLWPANHELVDVGFASSSTDNCAGAPIMRVSVTSDEPTTSADGAGGDKGPDAVVLRDPSGAIRGIRLRAERSSAGNGRVYRITVDATDACGNAGSSFVVVSVSPNGNPAAVDDGQFYDATQVN